MSPVIQRQSLGYSAAVLAPVFAESLGGDLQYGPGLEGLRDARFKIRHLRLRRTTCTVALLVVISGLLSHLSAQGMV